MNNQPSPNLKDFVPFGDKPLTKADRDRIFAGDRQWLARLVELSLETDSSVVSPSDPNWTPNAA